VRKVGDAVEFTFPSSKNDQMHQGQVTLVTANNLELCPVKIMELYFHRFGYRWGRKAETRDIYMPGSGKKPADTASTGGLQPAVPKPGGS
jgi:hypothetical protein